MPKLDGVGVLIALREDKNDIPILMLTARDAVQDRVAGLDRGADDYLVKPFATDELIARVRALLRRTGKGKSEKLSLFRSYPSTQLLARYIVVHGISPDTY